MPIHYEVQFIMYEDEFYLIPQLKAIMEDWDAYVPIVADAEITRTYWSDKEEYNG
jgi:IMP cyclohydrolase